jgi:hypothetical protein
MISTVNRIAAPHGRALTQIRRDVVRLLLIVRETNAKSIKKTGEKLKNVREIGTPKAFNSKVQRRRAAAHVGHWCPANSLAANGSHSGMLPN